MSMRTIERATGLGPNWLQMLLRAVNVMGGPLGDGRFELLEDDGAGSCYFQLDERTEVMYCTPDWEGDVGVTCAVYDENGDVRSVPHVEIDWARDLPSVVDQFQAAVRVGHRILVSK